ncbi:hypothetical protein MKX01_039995 [Papaver californicum]|nr:hypothetical protein MKX01_039995 [Papaver californicum]
MLNYDFCVSAFESNPKSKTSDLSGLGVISMELYVNNATNLLPYISKLLEDGKQERFVKQALDTCLEVYTDAIRCANEAITAFKNNDYNNASVNVADVFSATYEDGFNERNLTFPLRKQVGFKTASSNFSCHY